MITSKQIPIEQAKAPIPESSEFQGALHDAQELVRKHFRGISNLHVEPAVDPESGELVFEVVFVTELRGQELMSSYEALTAEWVQSVHWTIRMHIRFIFTIA